MLHDPKFETYDYAIGGKMVVGKATMDQSFMELMQNGDFDAKQNVKKTLIMQMAEYMLENNLVEFTQQKGLCDPHTFQDTTVIMVRAYLAPNDQVKILRLANKIV
jgi:hypothetical protein